MPKAQSQSLNNTEAGNILGINSTGTVNCKEVKIAYRKLSYMTHPDKNQNDLKAAESAQSLLNAAYEALCSK
ncbi:MAG: J domain-containing protein [Gammaproteobacteria bacterium]|nr:J domain-containing protein [Gammaproteobacteria bacterium]